MANIQVGLTPLTVTTPTLPTGITTLSVDSSVLPLVVVADTNTLVIDVMVGGVHSELTNPVLVNNQNQFTGSVNIPYATTPQVVEISGRNYTDALNPPLFLITPTIQFEIIYAQSNLGTEIAPPSGVTIYKGASTCRVEWAIPTVTGFQGVRVQWSTDPSGVTVPWQQYGNLSNGVTRSAQVDVTTPVVSTAITPNPEVTGQNPTNTVVTTSTGITTTVNYDSINIPQATTNADLFYVILTTVVQDPTTNDVYESQAAGPFTAGYVDLHLVKPTDFLALQKAQDIAGRLIGEMTRRRPDLDLTARSEFRDCIINPFALELANMSVREWYARESSSISALAQIDNQSGNGISDPVASSPVKQQIAQAYGLSQSSVQAFIDKGFDILGNAAGIERGGATKATVMLTFFTYRLPTTPINIPVGLVCSTMPTTTSQTAVTFVTTGSGVIDPASANALYISELDAWGISVPAQAQVAGTVGNVGEGMITQITGGISNSGVSVINQVAAADGLDEQSNADYAAMIQNTAVVGKDTGTRYGYWKTAMQIPGINQAIVVAAGDLDMVRDWSQVNQRHLYGCVDIYVQGDTFSQQTEGVASTFPSTSTYGELSTYYPCTLVDKVNLGFSISGFSTSSPLYTAVQFAASAQGVTIYLGSENAQFDNTHGIIYLNPSDNPYTINTDGSTSVWQMNGANGTNYQFIQSLGSTQTTYALMAQIQAGINHIPALQPVTNVNSIYGPITGSIPTSDIELFHTEDFLLDGGSNGANDTVSVSGSLTNAMVKTINVSSSVTPIDSNMALSLGANGQPGNVISVRSSDLSTVYTFGVDYTIIGNGTYHSYALNILSGSAITPSATLQLVVAYNKYLLTENVALQTDALTLSGSTPATLSQSGFVHNSWLPANHGQTFLLLNGQSVNGQAPTGLIGAGIAPAYRYILVTYNNGVEDVVCSEGRDFTLSVSSNLTATITRVLSGGIPDGATVSVTYYYLEVLSVATEYPAFVDQLSTQVDTMKHAGADVLVKAMTPNAVDFVFNVVLNSSTTPSSVDGTLRTQVALALAAANGNQTQANQQSVFSQSALVQLLQGVTGVQSIELPLLKCAKADGSYNIGVIIPTGTVWNPLSGDPSFTGLSLPQGAFISEENLLPDPTIPSGGTPNSYVGMLYGNTPLRRAMSVEDFLASSGPSFYLIGANDTINENYPLPVTYSGRILICGQSTPALNSYRVTYQCYGAASADDITVTSPEYLVPGTITINYVS